MRDHDLSPWRHSHDFGNPDQRQAERRTHWVIGLTLAAMALELVAGWLTGSMALLADGWHMGSHAAALGIAAYAYAFARRRGGDPRFTFGTGKVSSLAGYSSALLLAAGALWMAVESVSRLLDPVPIHYQEAMAVAAFGLAVNLASAWLLGHHGYDHHDHGHGHGHADDHRDDGQGHDHQTHGRLQDHNLKAAYLHVLADALTSVLALVALGLGFAYGWSFLDPLMGIAGALLVGRWAFGLARESAQVLVDAGNHDKIASEIREAIECDSDTRIADLHIWRIAPAGHACIVSLVTHQPKPIELYRERLAGLPGLLHVTVEVNQCRQAACQAARQARSIPA
ncbi:cation diffusion facilitator family transporter [Thioflavicoccus mobilis 8321]|uniref:Cation diffusion facilitator family transporter n=1 Tax=Thioflavicoccus mobilis 8321 TaxID=765912 RepID=L0GUZ2_9GAMM|nr:CDF family Co(II)/Ni(II) efflux transporter DmeF [Thioflavicoccus mobilis]AGA90563.1 cation diffusion facilitator family transporter [Thioflavicoccus mobilis 8321]